jgi:hypothetical protein
MCARVCVCARASKWCRGPRVEAVLGVGVGRVSVGMIASLWVSKIGRGTKERRKRIRELNYNVTALKLRLHQRAKTTAKKEPAMYSVESRLERNSHPSMQVSNQRFTFYCLSDGGYLYLGIPFTKI